MALPDFTTQQGTEYKTNIDATLASLEPLSGSWTPTILDNSNSPSEGQTYSAGNAGFYQVIGKMVFARGQLAITSLGSLTTTQQAKIGGLPFAAKNSAGSLGVMVVGYARNLALASATSIVTGTVEQGQARIQLEKSGVTSGTGTLPISEISSNGIIRFTLTYELP